MIEFPFCRKVIAALVAMLLVLGGSGSRAGFDASKYDLQITAGGNETGKLIVAELRKKFPSARMASGSGPNTPHNKRVVHVAVGPAALRMLLSQNVEGVVVSLFTSSQAYKEILDEAPKADHHAITAIFAEPSPSEQLRLISAIYRKPVRVAVLLSDKNAYLAPVLQQAATRLDISLSLEPVSREDDLTRLLNRVAKASVLLALPDNAVYSAENIRTILITTYRRGQAVVGFSAAFVKAGALASTVSSISDILAQFEEEFAELAATGRVPEARFPKYFDVVVNDSVARSLNLVIDEEVKKIARKPEGYSQ